MLEMLQAHGLDAGPTQRPVPAGVIAGVLADLPALALLHLLGSLQALAGAAGHSLAMAGGWHALAMALAGSGYGLLFRRAANDPAGGWLFGMAYGFLVWLAVAVPVLQWLPPRPLMTGTPALGLFLGQLLWGLLLGAGFGPVHRPLQSGIGARTPPAARAAGSRDKRPNLSPPG